MNKKIIEWWRGGGSQYTSEYQAVLDRATALGYTAPSDAQKVKQNTLVAALKSAGIWTGLDVFYVFATDGDRNFAKINWKAPSSFLCTESNTPTFTTNVGFTGNGSNMLLDTTFNARTSGTNFTQNEAGMYGYFSGTFDGMLAGVFVTNPCVFRAATNTFYINSATASNTVSTLATGFWHGKRTASNASAIFKNGVQTNSVATTSGTPDNQTLQILRANPSTYSNVTCGCFGAGGSLNGLESAFYSAWNTYLTSL